MITGLVALEAGALRAPDGAKLKPGRCRETDRAGCQKRPSERAQLGWAAWSGTAHRAMRYASSPRRLLIKLRKDLANCFLVRIAARCERPPARRNKRPVYG